MRKYNSNTRKAIRRNLIFYLSVTDNKNGSDIGVIFDITQKGLLLLTEHLFSVGHEMIINVELPRGPDFPKKTLELDVIVQWSRKDTANPDLSLVGCKIIDPEESEKQLIQLLINTIGFSNGQKHVTFNESVPDFTESKQE